MPARVAPRSTRCARWSPPGRRLSPEGFAFVYEAVKRDVLLTSVSGGTDIVGCFVGGNPNGPVWAGEIQAPGLGMDVAGVRRRGPAGRRRARRARVRRIRFRRCRSGSGTIRTAFDTGRRISSAFPGVWCHGDWAAIDRARWDRDLRPVGRDPESRRRPDRDGRDLPPGRALSGDSRKHCGRPAVGRRRAHRCCSYALRPGSNSTRTCRRRVSARLRTQASPRHVPARIVAGARHPAHAERQDCRTGGAARRSWSAGAQQSTRWPTRRRSTTTGTGPS